MSEENFTLEQIEAEMSRLQELADKRRQQEKGEVIKVIQELVKQHKLQSRDVFPPKAKTGATVPAKYQDPHVAENKWSGRGKMPNWLAAYVAQGFGVDTFLIPAATPATPAALEAAPDADAEVADEEDDNGED